ncbi:MAG: acetate--CoA ligase family protein [Solirubrobacterales bacterium]
MSGALDLTPLLEPRSVAVVGASDKPDSYGGNVLENLRRAGYEGAVHGVNPGRETARGYPCVPTLADLPEAPDAVVVAIPAPGVPAVIAEAAELGCGGAVVVSAGFAEADGGEALQAELREAALAASLPVCGPNGNGVIAAQIRAPLWGDSVAPLEPGPVAMISQSGNIAVNALGSRRGLRFHTVVSSGNQAVLDASDWLAAIARRDGVRSVALFLEEDGDGAKLAEALAECAEAGVGVAVLKVGTSEAGARAAAAHTASVAGDQRVFRALVEEAGAAWASDPHELLELAKALAEPRARPSGHGGLAVLTCSGGDSGLAADQAERMGIELPALAPATRGTLTGLLPDAATVANPLDYTAMIWGDVELLAAIVGAVGADPGIDQLLVLYDHPQGLAGDSEASWRRVREGILAGADATDAAVLVASTLPDLINDEATAELAAGGVVGLAGLTGGLACARALRAAPGDPSRLREIAAAARAAAAADGAGSPGARANGGSAGVAGHLDEAEAKALLAEAGIPVPRGRTATDADDAVGAWRELGRPVALKRVERDLLHKSEAGALALGLDDEDALRAAHAAVSNGGAPVLVEEMAAGEAELLVSVSTDGVVPALVIGAGGLWTELLADAAIVPLPASAARVEQAIRSLRAAPLLTGGRGREPLAIAEVAALAVRAAELALRHGLSLLELNPVIVGRDGAVAADAVIARRAA